MICLDMKLWNVMTYIKRYIALYGCGPSMRDIEEACGLSSTSQVMYRLNELEELGLLTRVPNEPRTIVLNRNISYGVMP